MADIWAAYIKKYNVRPKSTTQLHQFSKASPSIKTLSFKEARDIFNAHQTKPVVTNGANKKPPIKLGAKPTIKPKINKPLPTAKQYNVRPKSSNIIGNNNNNNNNNNKQEIKRQIDECSMEIKNLGAVSSDFEKDYNAQITDIEKQFKNMYDALKKREMDLKRWRKQEYDEGINAIKSTQQILENRSNDLQNNPNVNLYQIPKLNDFSISLQIQSLQIQNTLNNIFQIGQTYQQNKHNKQFISLKINKNPQNNMNNIQIRMKSMTPVDKHKLDFSSSPFGKGKIIKKNNNNYINNNKRKVINYNNNNNNNNNAGSGIRGYDIGNNTKYANAQQMAQKTNALPSNFWEDESDSDSEQERQESQQEIANRWKTQESNIRSRNADACTNELDKRKKRNARPKGLYDADSSSDDENDENDGFEKYVAPIVKEKEISEAERMEQQLKEEEDYWKNNNTKWIIYEENKQFEYDSLWFGVPKMRNGKANGGQMKSYMVKSGLSNDILKRIWKLSDLDKDGKMGNEEFALCMYLIDKVKKGYKLPDQLPKNYVPPSFRGKKLVKTPPKKSKPLPNTKSMPPNMNLAKSGNKNEYEVKPKQKQNKQETVQVNKDKDEKKEKEKQSDKNSLVNKDDKSDIVQDTKDNVSVSVDESK